MSVLIYNLYMHLTVKIKLVPDDAQKSSLLKTFRAFNSAATDAARVGFKDKVHSQPSIHARCYKRLRSEYGLNAQLAVRAIGKAVECFKRDKSKCPKFKPLSAIVYDQRIMRFKGVTHVSLSSLDGRLEIPMIIAGYQDSRLQQAIKVGQADLVYIDKVFYLLVSIEIKDVPPSATGKFIGVDLGVSKIAVDSEGNAFDGDKVDAKRQWFNRRRRKLQATGTKSAKRRLVKLRNKESAYRRTVNHQIARRIVDTAKGLNASIKLEDLSGIRNRLRKRFRKSQRNRISGWSFFQLRAFIEYKARMAGVIVEIIDPRNTSRTCSKCGYCDKKNRKNQSKFECIQCGYSVNADHNAAANIAARPSVNAAMVGTVDAKAGLALS